MFLPPCFVRSPQYYVNCSDGTVPAWPLSSTAPREIGCSYCGVTQDFTLFATKYSVNVECVVGIMHESSLYIQLVPPTKLGND